MAGKRAWRIQPYLVGVRSSGRQRKMPGSLITSSSRAAVGEIGLAREKVPVTNIPPTPPPLQAAPASPESPSQPPLLCSCHTLAYLRLLENFRCDGSWDASLCSCLIAVSGIQIKYLFPSSELRSRQGLCYKRSLDFLP